MPSFGRRNCIRKPNAACDAFGRLRKLPLVGRTLVQALRSWYVTQPLRFSGAVRGSICRNRQGTRTLLNFYGYPDQPSCLRWDIPVKRSAMASPARA